MRVAHHRAQVAVPATSGNLGPGFDCMGMAHDIWDQVEVRVVPGESGVHDATSQPTPNPGPRPNPSPSPEAHVTIHGEGADYLPRDGSHLVVRALRRALDHVGVAQPSLELTCTNGIRQGRGLGSSASAVVAGLMLARGLVDEPEALNDQVMLQLATEFEGHPDNAAPAIYGGAVVAWCDGAGAHALPIHVRGDVRTTLLIPDAELLTETARSVLPEQVPHRDAAFNASRTALLVLALEHEPNFLYEATEEKLHQSYRAASMQASANALDYLRMRRFPAVISGAGPSILVLGELDDEASARMAASGFSEVRGMPASGAYLIP
ncbi:MAG: homoserine kinase [Ancrocorticia sp.]|uniref:homoserine kinase n=1 Tax=Ancrocorticia sp. TaxID=2593684 RepID=UPI003F926EEF